MAKIQAFPSNNPIYAQQFFTVKIALYEDNGNFILLDNSVITFSILENEEYLNSTVDLKFLPLSPLNYIIRFYFIAPGISLHTDLSFVAITQTIQLTSADIYNLLQQELPLGVYNTDIDSESGVYIDNLATSTIIGGFYNILSSMNNLVYPENQYDANWEYVVNNTYNLLSAPADPSFNDYKAALVIQFLRNIKTQVSLSPFDIVSAITTYIYLRTGREILVFLGESNIDPTQYWILGVSTLNNNTRLAPSGNLNRQNLIIYIFDLLDILSDNFKIELQNFIKRIIRAGIFWEIEYTTLNPTDEPYFLIPIGYTYRGDPRTRFSYAFQYDDTIGYPFNLKAFAYIYQPNYFTEFEVILTPVAPITSKAIMTIMGKFLDLDSYEKNITSECYVINKTPSIIKLIGHNIIIPLQSGTAELEIEYYNNTTTVSYTVII